MALGGGTFVTQNKVLPGTYMNFVSAVNAGSALSERGIATLPLSLSWGPEGEMFTVTAEGVQKDSRKIFGCAYTDDALKPVREVFRHARTVHFFRLNTGGKKAENQLAEAKYPGTCGNKLRVVIEASEESTTEAPKYDVSTYLETTLMEVQEGVSSAAELVPNDYVTWKDVGTLELTASALLSGGTDGTVPDAAWQAYLDQAEAYTFNTMGCPSNKPTIAALFAAFCRRMRDEVGKKCQVVCFRSLADYEGVVSVKNTSQSAEDDPALVAWVTGALAGRLANQSADSMAYDGEYVVDTKYTQTQLEAGIREGSFLFHLEDGAVHVLSDVNTLVSVTGEKSADFSSNQTIRVLDQIATDIAALFAGKYRGEIPNDDAGRISLWNDIVKHHNELQKIRAIENLDSENLTVEKGETKKAVAVVDHVTPVNAMAQLYMTVYVQ